MARGKSRRPRGGQKRKSTAASGGSGEDAQSTSTSLASAASIEDACICHWPDCRQLRRSFMEHNHPLGSRPVQLQFSNTCNFQNLWHNLCINLSISNEEKEQIEEAYRNSGEEGKGVRVCIARHHWTPEIVELRVTKKKVRAVTPLSPAAVAKGRLLPEAYKTDGQFKYNPNLGNGRAESWKKDNPTMYIQSPCQSRHTVKAIVDGLTADDRRSRRRLAEETAPRQPPPDDWEEILRQKNEEITELYERIRWLEEQLQELRLEKKRASDRKHKQAQRAKKELEVYQMDAVLWAQINGLLAKAGGLSRLTIFNDQWHANHEEAASVLFGYRNWDETKEYVRCHFPDEVDTSARPVPILPQKAGDELAMPALNSFERCLLCRMFFHLRHKQKLLALIIDRDRTSVGKILKDWAPRWGEVGEDMSDLDITEDYLTKEEPDKLAQLGLRKVMFNDGKDFRIGSKLNDNVTAKLMYGSKNDCDTSRSEMWTTPAGLGVECTRDFAGNISENALQRLQGSLGRAKADVESWEDVGKQQRYKPSLSERHWSALDDMLTAEEVRVALSAESVEQMMDDICAFAGVGAVHDDTLETAKATGIERLGLNDREEDESDSEDEDESAPGPAGQSDVFANIADLREWAKQTKQLKAAEKAHNSHPNNQKKMAPLLSPERLEKLIEKGLRLGPNSSGWRKLRQLEHHERLHRSYEAGRLHKCLLSYFLLVTTPDRRKLLAWMGSSMVPGVEKPAAVELPTIYLRLAKIPPAIRIVTDKGFKGTDRDYPWMNRVLSPTKLADMKNWRKTAWHIRKDKPLCSARFSSETYFFRVDQEDLLKDVIPYWIIPMLPHAHALANGQANLCMPFRVPGKDSIVGPDYWENKKDYTRIRTQQTVQDVEMREASPSSVCRQCASHATDAWHLWRCQKCNELFHEDCHDRDACKIARNPYAK